MKNTLPKNPFASKVYLGKAYFCDRQEETQAILSYLENGNSISIIALRRIGKTGLIKHIAENLPTTSKMVYIDILETESMEQFLSQLTSALLKQFPEKSYLGKQLWDFIKTLRPTLNFDPLSGAPQASFSNTNQEPERNIELVFEFLEQQQENIIIAIDEFQQILEYPENNVEAWLRSRVQQLKNIHFIFSGSQQHLMTELFLHPNRPFYRSTQIVRLQKIDKEIYSTFIVRMFNKYHKTISKTMALQILDWCDAHTFYVQQLCNRVFALDKETIEEKDWKQEASRLLKENELLFFAYREMLSKHQWALLQAIAANNRVYQPTSQAFITSNKLASSATILKSIAALLKIGIVFKDYEEDGKPFYGVYDIYMRRWCEIKQMGK